MIEWAPMGRLRSRLAAVGSDYRPAEREASAEHAERAARDSLYPVPRSIEAAPQDPPESLQEELARRRGYALVPGGR